MAQMRRSARRPHLRSARRPHHRSARRPHHRSAWRLSSGETLLAEIRKTSDYVLILETDHVIMKPIPNLATPEMPAAFVFGYMYPQQNQLWVIKKYWPEGTLDKVQLSPLTLTLTRTRTLTQPYWPEGTLGTAPPSPLPTGTADRRPLPQSQHASAQHGAPLPTPHRYSQSAPPPSSSTSTSSRRCTRNGSISRWTFAPTRTPRRTFRGGYKRCGATRSRPLRSASGTSSSRTSRSDCI